jgi:hypothetical protein
VPIASATHLWMMLLFMGSSFGRCNRSVQERRRQSGRSKAARREPFNAGPLTYVDRIHPPAPAGKRRWAGHRQKPSRRPGRGSMSDVQSGERRSASPSFSELSASPNFCDRGRGQNLLGSVTYRAIGGLCYRLPGLCGHKRHRKCKRWNRWLALLLGPPNF